MTRLLLATLCVAALAACGSDPLADLERPAPAAEAGSAESSPPETWADLEPVPRPSSTEASAATEEFPAVRPA